jgi:UDP-N-acetylmuramoyl-tripeptide--D-alanyl-D-alanine ligase
LLAKEHRKNMQARVIALTGSNGKTTVKEMIAAMLPKPSYATSGNFNNELGVALSVLQLEPQVKHAVFELGARRKGDIGYTLQMVKPDIALINNIGAAHVEIFGSIDAIAEAKGEIYEGLAKDGIAIVNEDDAYAHFWDDILKDKKTIRFSTTKQTDVYAKEITLDEQGCAVFSLIAPNGHYSLHLKVPGLHQVHNALAAASCLFASDALNEEAVARLNAFTGVAGRLAFLPGKNQSTVIDDTYNANLRSVLMAIQVLANRPGKRIFVFGDMGELGEWAHKHHQEVGLAAKNEGIDILMSCGVKSALASESFGPNAKHYENQDALAEDLLQYLDKDTTVLVKGSRASAMEKIVRQLV